MPARTRTPSANGATETNGTNEASETAEIETSPFLGKATGITIPEIKKARIGLTLIGDSPLIQHKWSEKAKREMLEKQMKMARTAKEAKDPERDFLDSLYIYEHEGGKYGFPAIAFKAAAVTAGTLAELKMAQLRRMFHVEGDMVPIYGEPIKREDMVRINMGTADIRYRGMFPWWKATLEIIYLPFAITPGQLINLFNLAGFGVGVGEWRPERDGNFGMFHVATEDEL